jgi:hypothetical protein
MENSNGKATIFTVIGIIVGSVLLPVFNAIKDSWVAEKEISYKEMGVNEKYLNVVQDLSESSLKKQLELAKYFSCVSTNEENREAWLRYYHLKQNEYKESIEEEKKIQKSIDSLKYDKGNYRTNLTDKDKEILGIKQTELSEIKNEQLIEPVKIKKIKKVYVHYSKNDNTNNSIRNKLQETDWLLPASEKLKSIITSNDIRYFNDDDIDLALHLKSIIGNNTFEIKKINMKAPAGQLEIWIKD